VPVATLLSEADERRFEHEWEAFPLTPANWRDVLTRMRPRLLFVSQDGLERIGRSETASAAADSGWSTVGLLKAFREAGVRTALWDNRVPASANRPLEEAALFDDVFCASESLCRLYVEQADTFTAHLLPWSVQTRVFNPTSTGTRRREVFALDREDREKDEDPLLLAAGELGLEVFASNGRDESHPDREADLELPGRRHLRPDEIAVAPKVFKLAIGPNLDEESGVPSRVLELAATATPVLVNESREIERVFGSAVLQVSNQAEAGNALKSLLRSDELRSRFSHRALRAVLRSETTSHRVDEVLMVGGLEDPRPTPSLTMMIPTNRPRQLPNILANLGRQTYPDLRAVLVLHGIHIDHGQVRDEAERHGVEHLEILQVDESVILGEVFNRGFSATGGEYVGKMDDDDFYGAEYAWDLMSAFTYTEADVVGKWAHYAYLESLDSLILRFGGTDYSYQPVVAISTLVMKRDVVEQVRFPAMPSGSGSQFLRAARAEGARVYSGDRYNYLYQRYSDDYHHTWFFSDFDLMAKSDFVSRGKGIDHVVN
jgi:hypothetical protein